MKSTVPHSHFTHRFFFLNSERQRRIKCHYYPNKMIQRVFHFCYYFFLLLPQWFNSCSGKKHDQENASAKVPSLCTLFQAYHPYCPATLLSSWNQATILHLIPRKTASKRALDTKKIFYSPVQLSDQDLQIFYELLPLFSTDKNIII